VTVTLVLGGTRSGKSGVAERLAGDAAGGGPVTYLATGTPTDPSMEARIQAHRDRRPDSWPTVEAGPDTDLVTVVALVPGVVLLDSLGTWVAGTWDGAAGDFAADGVALAAALAGREPPTVVVSEEVGLSIHPGTPVGRRFVDAIGEVNQAVAAVASRVVLVVAGRTLEL
jgi:adenosyl cobinamide kinase/adenosyl cobinamide phosphate guanylyltransferase